MTKINALVDLFFKDMDWEERVRAIANYGCRYIETWQGADRELLCRLHRAGQDAGVQLISIVMNSPNAQDVAPVNPDNIGRFTEQIDRFSDNALAAGCRAGIVTTGPAVAKRGYQAQRRALVKALRAAGELAAAKGFRLNLEPLNTEIDHAGYFLDSPAEGVAIVKEVGLENVRLLYDVYHMTIMTGNQTMFIENNLKWIGHFHAAGVPGRHEPFDGEFNYPFLLRRIDEMGYDGCMGLEYMPLRPCPATLVETLEYLRV